MPIRSKRGTLWIAVAGALAAAGCASGSPGGLNLLEPAVRTAALVRVIVPQARPLAASGRAAVLEGVSCPRPDSCVAVGFSLGQRRGHFHPLAEAWNGTTWRVLPAPPLPGGSAGDLASISCPGVTGCIAVGSATIAGRQTGLAESWNGTSWHRLRLPFPRGAAAASLSGVACQRRTCMIVGAYRRKLPGDPLPLAMQLRGTRPRLLPPLLPRGRTSGELADVSCASAAACMAVGDYLHPQGHNAPPVLAMAETWNGTSWRMSKVPTPGGAPESQLRRISCPNPTRCVATGSFDFLTALSTRPLTELWTAGRWRALRIAGPRIRGFVPFGVSCGSAGDCLAVGSSFAAGTERPGAERWNGRALRMLQVPRPGSGELAGVACTGPARCMAVGDARGSTLAELWNGTSWRVLPAPGG